MAKDQRCNQLDEIYLVAKVLNRLASERIEETLRDLAYRGRMEVGSRISKLEAIKGAVDDYLGLR
ncbi:MAG: hypothetical protein M0019_09725 [Actinomycetota bacterium]|nr:hypothetical protein [Actinomycetota bacterium]